MEIEKLKKLIEKPIKELGYILDDVKFITEDGTKILMVSIDNEKSITIDDCVKVTEAINPIIDENDNNEENYILDVCSKEKGNE